MSVLDTKDSISNLSFNHDGQKVVFDRCRGGGCQIQVYDLETGELAAYQSPKGERWTMGKYAYDGKRITFSVIPVSFTGQLDLGQMQIAVMDVDGKNYRKVTTGFGAKLYPAFSHNGNKILYACAAHIRTQGRTPAAQYDAWEVNLETGEQTQLTFFKYYYMSSLTYFPDDERFIYNGEMPAAFPGLKPLKDDSVNNQEMIKQRQIKNTIPINGVVAMKIGDTLPRESFNFGSNFHAKRPLLSKDGSKLIVEKDISGGKFFLYSPDGKHRLVSHSGSVHSVAISPDGQYFGSNFDDSVFIKKISDGEYLRAFFVRRSEEWEESVKKMPYIRLLPRIPSMTINCK